MPEVTPTKTQEAAPEVSPQKGGTEAKRPTKRVLISTKSPHDPPYVDLGLNGKVIRVKRDVEVDLPLEYVEVLQNAVDTIPVKKLTTDPHEYIWEEYDIPRFAYQIRS